MVLLAVPPSRRVSYLYGPKESRQQPKKIDLSQRVRSSVSAKLSFRFLCVCQLQTVKTAPDTSNGCTPACLRHIRRGSGTNKMPVRLTIQKARATQHVTLESAGNHRNPAREDRPSQHKENLGFGRAGVGATRKRRRQQTKSPGACVDTGGRIISLHTPNYQKAVVL